MTWCVFIHHLCVN